MTANPLLGPLFAMVALTFVIWATMGVRRTRAVATGATHLSRFAVRGLEGITPEARQVSDHFQNLFEMPVLFYVAVLIALHLGLTGPALPVLAWVFVVFRVLHAWVHLGRNEVRYRFYAFVASSVTLLLMWLVIAAAALAG
jgi:hypothetical protein